MGSIRVPISSDQAISDFLSNIPDGAKANFRRGYTILAGLPDEKREAFLVRSIESLEEGSMSGTLSELQEDTALREPDVEAALGAVMLLVSGTTGKTSAAAKEDVLSELVKAKLLDPGDLSKMGLLLASLKKRGAEIETRVERSQLASRILPAFRESRTAVDLRVDSGEKRLAVAVGLIHIGTDMDDKEIQFQLSSAQLKKFIKRLQDLQREIDEVEKLAQVWEKKRG